MLRLVEHVLINWTGLARRLGLLLVVAFLAATGLAGVYAAKHLKVNTDTSAMIDPSLPFQVRAAELKEAFPDIKNDLAIIVRAKTFDEAEAYAAALRERLLARDDFFTSVFSPSAEPFFLENGLLYLSESDLEERLAQLTRASGLIETLVKAPTIGVLFKTLADNDALAERADIGTDTLNDIYAELGDVAEASLRGEDRPFAWQGALNVDEPGEEGYIRIVYASPQLDFSRLQPAKPAIAALNSEIDALGAGGRVDFLVTGEPALRADELAAVSKGIGLSLGLSLLLVAFLLVIAFRSASVAAMTLASLVITLIMTGAFAAATVGELNLVSVAFTVLLVGLGLDFAIHLLLHVQERRADGEDQPMALKSAVHQVGAALTLAAPTTAIGFFAFAPTKFIGIAQLGIIAGSGVIIAFLVAVTFLPAALGAFSPAAPKPSSGAVRGAFAALERWSSPIAAITILVGLGALTIIPQARFDADPMALRDPTSPSVRGFNLLFSDPNTLPYRLTRLVGTREEALATAESAKSIKTVKSVRSLPDFVPEDQDAKLELIDFAAGTLAFALGASEDRSAAIGAPDGAEALRARLIEAHAPGSRGARLAGFLETALDDPSRLAAIEDNVFRYWPMLVERLERQLDAAEIDEGALPDALVRRYRSQSGRWRIDLLPAEDVRDPAARRRFTESAEALFPDIGGGAIQTQKAGDVISAAMLQATGIALAVITVFLWILLRRLSDVALMILPLALAAALTAACGVLIDVPFNYANVIVLPLLLGIGVDSGIHLVMRQRHIEHGDTVLATSTPRAILFSALTTVASFASLMLSPHRGTASMGQLLSIAIAFTLICTLVVLPAALRWRDDATRRRRPAREKPDLRPLS